MVDTDMKGLSWTCNGGPCTPFPHVTATLSLSPSLSGGFQWHLERVLVASGLLRQGETGSDEHGRGDAPPPHLL